MENPKMDKQRFETGMEIRKSVLGREFVEKSFAAADDFNREQQELVTEYCWGAVWGRPGLEKKTRSMLNLAMLSALNRPHELKMHVAGALRNGVTRDEIKEVFLAVMIYAGVPACVDSFRIAREVFAEFDAQKK
jgi:4-carboxymuconolactone decarboxylase